MALGWASGRSRRTRREDEQPQEKSRQDLLDQYEFPFFFKFKINLMTTMLYSTD